MHRQTRVRMMIMAAATEAPTATASTFNVKILGQVQTRALVICFNLFLVKFNQLYFPMLFFHLNVSDKYESK